MKSFLDGIRTDNRRTRFGKKFAVALAKHLNSNDDDIWAYKVVDIAIPNGNGTMRLGKAFIKVVDPSDGKELPVGWF